MFFWCFILCFFRKNENSEAAILKLRKENEEFKNLIQIQENNHKVKTLKNFEKSENELKSIKNDFELTKLQNTELLNLFERGQEKIFFLDVIFLRVANKCSLNFLFVARNECYKRK